MTGPPPDFADAVPAMIWVQAPDGRFTFFNRVWLDFTGRPLEEELRGGWMRGLHSDDRKRSLDIAVRSFEARIPYRIDCRIQRHDGQYRWIYNTGMPRFDPGGEFLGFVGSAIDITDRRDFEDQAKQNRFFLEKAEEVAHVGYWVSDFERGGRLIWSRETLRIFGVDEARFDGRVETFFARVHPEDLEFVQAESTAALEGRRPYDVEHRIIRPDGVMRWVHQRAEIERDPAGKPFRMIGVCQDVTAGKLATEALRRSEARYRLLSRATRETIWDWDLVADTIEWGEGLEALFGYPPREVDPKSSWWSDRIHPEERASEISEIRALIDSGGQFLAREYRWLRKDGSYAVVSDRGFVIHNEEGRPIRMIGSMSDVTARRRAEEALQESEERFRFMAEHINEAFWMADPQRKRFYYVSPGYQRIWGRPVDSLLANPASWFDAIHPDDRARVVKATRQAEEAYGEAYRINRPDGSTVWVLDRGWPVRDRAGRIYRLVGTALDISDLKRTEEEVLLRAKELARSNEELERFAYAASHDLQEPLRMISSYVQLIKKRYTGKLDANADEFIRYAAEGAHRMQALIQDLLAYSRVDVKPATLRPVALGPVVDHALANLEVLVQEAKAVVTRGELPTVIGQATLLTQAFQNLIHNAIKFREDRVPEVRITAERRDREWVISVADNGIGIDPAYHSRLFILFQRLHSRERFQGSGLGLALCKKIVERHGGRIWVESEKGKGSTFRIALPADDGQAAPS